MEKDGGVDGDDEDGRDDDDGSVCMLVEEDGDVDEVNCCLGSEFENGHGLGQVSPLDTEVYRHTNQVDGSGLVAGET